MLNRAFRVGFDARWITERGSGVAVYSRELLRALLQLRVGISYVALFPSESVRDFVLGPISGAKADRCEAIVVTQSPVGVRNQLCMPGIVRSLGLDIFHSPEFIVPFGLLTAPRQRQPLVLTTIHDVIPLSLDRACPRSFKNRVRPLYRLALSFVARRADAVVTVSSASCGELARLLKTPAERLHVVYNGVSPVFRPSERCIRQRPPVVLYVGRQDPYKGLDTLVVSFAELRNRYRIDARLAVVGFPDPRYPEAQKLASSLRISDSVDWLGFLSESELVSAYQRAAVLVLPSRFEGFGLPVLEAMACGTPVVCTRAGGLPEVAGEAAEYVLPGDTRQLCRTLMKILTDEASHSRLSQLGVARAALFSWTRSARETADVYRSVLKGRLA